jgi:FkbM family methyltransferase
MKVFTQLYIPLIKHPLNFKNKFKALLNFVKWQVRLRLVNPCEIVVSFTSKSKFIVKKGRTGLTGNLYCGLHEFEDMMFLLHFLRSEDHFFDIGANVGSYSILANSHVGAKTISFEPLPATVELLKNNKAINDSNESWKIEQLAIGDKENSLWFTSDRDTMNQIVEESYQGNKIKVDVISLDQYCNEHEIVPSLIKVDAEGFDENVIVGGENTLTNELVKALIIESDTEIVKIKLSNAGFEPYTYEPFSRKLSKGYNSGTNQIYIKDLELIQDRIKNADKVSIKGYSI